MSFAAMSDYPRGLHRLLLISLGCYFLVNNLLLLSEYEIFIPRFNRQLLFVPNLAQWISLPFVWALLGGGALAGAVLATGKWTKTTAVSAWVCWMAVLNLHPLIILPSDGYAGWLLLALLFVPKPDENWQMPEDVWTAGWLVTGGSYFASGWSKLMTDEWITGAALEIILQGVAAREHFINTLLVSLPSVFLQLATWGSVFIELAALPLCLFAKGRRVLWLGLLIFHVAIFMTIDITSITCIFFVWQLFLLRTSWLPAKLRIWK